MSTFGTFFRVTTFGESHCFGVGAVVDGVPPNLDLTELDIQPQLTRRRPGQSNLTTPRDEKDKVKILSGTERGKTLGTPIGLLVENLNVRPGDYKEMDTIPRPGHADYCYQMKYGIRAASGGGRSSARETIGRVAAGAIAEKVLKTSFGTEIVSWVHSIGNITLPEEVARSTAWTREQVDELGTLELLRDPSLWKKVGSSTGEPSQKKQKGSGADAKTVLDQQKVENDKYESIFIERIDKGESFPAYRAVSGGSVFDAQGNVLEMKSESVDSWSCGDIVSLRCPHGATAAKMSTLIRQTRSEKDSIGGVVGCCCRSVPVGLGEPCFDKIEGLLAHAMLSLPATKGFEIGSGFDGTKLKGSEHNDPFEKAVGTDAGGATPLLKTTSNNAGGTLGGITNGADIYFKVAVKSVSTIGRAQNTASYGGSMDVLEAKGRHDPCVLPRTPPLIEGMACLVLADCLMLQRARGPSLEPRLLPSS